MGPLHGVLFLGWLGAVVAARRDLRWSNMDVMAAVLWALVPFGAYAQLDRR